jgi:hypothetical protein
MFSYGSSMLLSRQGPSEPSEELRVAITFPPPGGGPGLTKFDAALSAASVSSFVPDPLKMDQAIWELSKLGFKLTKRGRLTASMRCKRIDFEKAFGTRLSRVELDPRQAHSFHSFYYPEQGAPWNPSPAVSTLIDDAYIQWPHIYMARGQPAGKRAASNSGRASKKPGVLIGPSAKPPAVDYFHLEVPNGIAALLNAAQVRQAGGTGKGVRVVMVDSGFAHQSHPFFATNGFTSVVDLAPHATNDRTDLNGHGTG